MVGMLRKKLQGKANSIVDEFHLMILFACFMLKDHQPYEVFVHRFEGLRGFYKGITANLLKNAPAASVTFIVYENVLNMLKLARRKDL